MGSYRCMNCQADLGGLDDRVVVQSESAIGDEVIRSQWQCAQPSMKKAS